MIKIYKIIILFILLYGCETWYLTAREHRVRVFENRVLRRIFGLNRDEVVEGWRTLHIEELHNLYTSPNIFRVIKSRKMRWVVHVGWMKDMRNVYKILVRRSEGKRTQET
jgi:hypothetical protein